MPEIKDKIQLEQNPALLKESVKIDNALKHLPNEKTDYLKQTLENITFLRHKNNLGKPLPPPDSFSKNPNYNEVYEDSVEYKNLGQQTQKLLNQFSLLPKNLRDTFIKKVIEDANIPQDIKSEFFWESKIENNPKIADASVIRRVEIYKNLKLTQEQVEQLIQTIYKSEISENEKQLLTDTIRELKAKDTIAELAKIPYSQLSVFQKQIISKIIDLYPEQNLLKKYPNLSVAFQEYKLGIDKAPIEDRFVTTENLFNGYLNERNIERIQDNFLEKLNEYVLAHAEAEDSRNIKNFDFETHLRYIKEYFENTQEFIDIRILKQKLELTKTSNKFLLTTEQVETIDKKLEQTKDLIKLYTGTWLKNQIAKKRKTWSLNVPNTVNENEALEKLSIDDTGDLYEQLKKPLDRLSQPTIDNELESIAQEIIKPSKQLVTQPKFRGINPDTPVKSKSKLSSIINNFADKVLFGSKR